MRNLDEIWAAIRQAQGDYMIARVDGDDVYAETCRVRLNTLRWVMSDGGMNVN